MRTTLTNIPGASPISNDLEDIKHADDPAYDKTTAPDDDASDEVEGEDVPQDEDDVEDKVADLE
ncbi:hypothetical protein Sa4125_11740 [Aureimonas sp. SA4125]|uniref:hypothetical protein n=1 Tax=Aureimonas sp. SA4125 TaxID=2826993 RepID=UPI001CC407FE|nr:hypothetical protein [Aureimonas sp. SA4125]BDA83632.1 hypothetical protein Sa4125_11740 [Aureimonas sp. SA4125]